MALSFFSLKFMVWDFYCVCFYCGEYLMGMNEFVCFIWHDFQVIYGEVEVWLG